jgi:hypothetical protein
MTTYFIYQGIFLLWLSFLALASHYWLLLALRLALDALFLYTYTSTSLLFLQIQDSKANSKWRSKLPSSFWGNLEINFYVFQILYFFYQQNYNNYPIWNFIFLVSFLFYLLFKVRLFWYCPFESNPNLKTYKIIFVAKWCKKIIFMERLLIIEFSFQLCLKKNCLICKLSCKWLFNPKL